MQWSFLCTVKENAEMVAFLQWQVKLLRIKRVKPTVEKAEISNETTLEAIFKLERKGGWEAGGFTWAIQAKQRYDCKLKEGDSENSLRAIVEIENSKEVNECKRRVEDLEVLNEHLRNKNYDLKERVREQERYRVRWSLWIKGIEEKKD